MVPGFACLAATFTIHIKLVLAAYVKVHQPAVYSLTDGITYLPRFQWGMYVFYIAQ